MHVVDSLTAPLPFSEAHRIVGIRNRNIAENRAEVRAIHDFFMWREELTSFEALAAARTDPYNVISEDDARHRSRSRSVSAAIPC